MLPETKRLASVIADVLVKVLDDDFITITEAARLRGCSRQTISRHIDLEHLERCGPSRNVLKSQVMQLKLNGYRGKRPPKHEPVTYVERADVMSGEWLRK